MALKPVFLLLLWGLTLSARGVSSLCNVTCSTDFETWLNCSCSGSVPTEAVLINVTCNKSLPDLSLVFNGSCEVAPPSSWCIIASEEIDEIAYIDTVCTSTASQHGDQMRNDNESSSWMLSRVVKPSPPVNVQTTNGDGFYNITWDVEDKKNCLTYNVRIRESSDLSKDPVHSIFPDDKYFEFLREKLQPNVNYIVDVRAKMCPGNLYKGPWSEWSSTAEWATETEGTSFTGDWRYAFLSIIPVLGLLLLSCLQKTYLPKNLLKTYVPTPDEFFKPLYNNYGGNFKKWVSPAFNEYDFQRIGPHVQMMAKQQDVLQWSNEKQSYSEDAEMKQGGHVLPMLQPHSNSVLFFQDGGSSQGAGHSTGHISIHTVTLSGEEEFEEEAMSQSSVNTHRIYQDGESFGSFEEDNREHVGYDLEVPQMPALNRQSGILAHQENLSNDLSMDDLNLQPHGQLNEPERVSLNSFASNEQSEDGYPHVDLDTIDSGFGECSSPGASDSNITEQTDSALFHEHISSNSNYVKQWLVIGTIQGDPSNSESHLHETP